MYKPLLEAFNFALEELSEVSLDGLPGFKSNIVCVPWDGAVISPHELPGSTFKPDITINNFSDAPRLYGINNHSLQLSEFVDAILDKQDGEGFAKANPTPRMEWGDILTTIEVKRDREEQWPDLPNFMPPTTHAGPSSGAKSGSTTCKSYLLYRRVCG
jgi:hypothetical protein